ncbi:MAG: metal ABC transporter permease [Ruminococcaceae bacterium]|nr:metal ABC transporter permease [Oscillospiraceae bacterium]
MKGLLSLLGDYTFRVVSLGAVLMGLISGLIGSFSVLERRSLLGDAVSHAALPGVVLIFLLTGSKSTEALMFGATLSGLTATFMILGIIRFSRIKFDSALALIMSTFFGFGLVLLTYAQKQPNAAQAGLDRFIFGQASAMLNSDLYIMLIAGSVLLALTLMFWKEIKLFIFDREYAHTLRFSPRKMDILLSAMTVTAIIVGLQTVGVILMSAMLVAPAAAARQWTNRLSVMVVLSSFLGGISGLIGTLISSLTVKIPTGPAIVVVASTFVIISMLFAPGRGIISRRWHRKKAVKTYQKEG